MWHPETRNVHLELLLSVPGSVCGPAVVPRVSFLLGQKAFRAEQPAPRHVQGGRQAHVQLQLVLTQLSQKPHRKTVRPLRMTIGTASHIG